MSNHRKTWQDWRVRNCPKCRQRIWPLDEKYGYKMPSFYCSNCDVIWEIKKKVEK